MAYNFKKSAVKKEGNEEEKKDSNLHGKCEAWGCTRMGHIHTGIWSCRYHFACHGENIAEQLSHVTLVLKNHEPEINWYEKLLCFTETEFVCRDLKHLAPVGMEVGIGESFRDYRDRVEKVINGLLYVKVVKSPDRKKLASGEKKEDSFSNFANFAPDF